MSKSLVACQPVRSIAAVAGSPLRVRRQFH